MNARPSHFSDNFLAESETNHRVANNLALIAAIVGLESRTVGDAQAAAVLAATQRRIQAVASVHRRLYRDPEGETVNLGEFLEELVDVLRTLVTDEDDRRTLTVRADDFDLPNDHAAAFAILVTELVGNACKHAYRVDVSGEVRVIFDAMPGGDWRLLVEDDGVGINHVGGGAHGLGSHIIQSVSRKLGVQHRWEPCCPGTRFLMWTGACSKAEIEVSAVTIPGTMVISGAARREQ
ncbi:sensor histidine kinase [Sphingomonas sp. NFR15]|uniref:sensor histidine kinase n=1 Tax=Sphingomonas sp. NFR15 TaxID=1566282 RepID=UPI000885E2D1|nr:sensor histidine kinase [Sphingomonas sp. NFR15]SDA35888.1 Two-component sensor histidine kinase, contains HisKA and HATPase domains [Sphingomonas sp. NFR15]